MNSAGESNPLTTPRLDIDAGVLRPWKTEDAPVLVRAWSDPDIAAWNAVPQDASIEFAARWIAGVDDRLASRTSIDWVIELGPGEGVVGEVGLSGFSERHSGALIGYWLLPRARGRGLATSAMRSVTEWAHVMLGLATIVAKCHTSNIASQQVASRSGYRHERSDSTGNQLWISRTRET